MGQSVTPDHPRAKFFLARDIANINRYFRDFCTVMDEKEIFLKITDGTSEGFPPRGWE